MFRVSRERDDRKARSEEAQERARGKDRNRRMYELQQSQFPWKTSWRRKVLLLQGKGVHLAANARDDFPS